jgi:hypothetical protein
VTRPHTHVHDAAPSADPTGTLPLRRRYASTGSRAWAAVAADARRAVGAEDMLGLAGVTAASIAATVGAGHAAALQSVLSDSARRRVGDGSWLRPLVERCYSEAVRRAVRLARMAAAPARTIEGAPARVDALVALARAETAGIAAAFVQQGVRAGVDAASQRLTPAAAARAVADRAQAVGATRTAALVEVIASKAFTEGTLDTFAEAGVTRVGTVPETRAAARRAAGRRDSAAALFDAFFDAPGSRASRETTPSGSTIARITRAEARVGALGEVEVLTAGDGDVCPICEGISEDGPYGIDTARALIPAHPACRCAFVPANDARFAAVGHDSQDGYNAAGRRSAVSGRSANDDNERSTNVNE